MQRTELLTEKTTVSNVTTFKPITGGTRISYLWRGNPCEAFTRKEIESAEAYLETLSDDQHAENIIQPNLIFGSRSPYSENW